MANTKTGRATTYRSLVDSSRSSIDSDGNWLITLSDVLCLLLVCFVLFFVMTKGTAKGTEPRQENVPPLPSSDQSLRTAVTTAQEEIMNDMDSLIRDLDMEEDVSVTTVHKGLVITMREKVTFRPGEAEILPASEVVLENIARLIERYPRYMVEIDGHTDNIPITSRLYPSNWELSVARATSVLRYFLDRQGLDPSRFSVRGFADQRPLTANEAPIQRAKNRRVEISLKERETPA